MGGDQPKPMVEIGGIPMLSHIMGIYKKYGHNEFIIAAGYKGEVIRDYYKHDSNVTCLETGLDSGTGERVSLIYQHLRSPFMLTYGDGLADIDINALLKSHKRTVTVTAVRPPARFGQIRLLGDMVMEFNEKPVVQSEWINGGFFVVSGVPYSLSSWEFDILPEIARIKELHAYKHTGFWQCMDTQRDVDYLNQLWSEGNAPWL
jgi:glucose-1-phosphate cytidylyltransferase